MKKRVLAVLLTVMMCLGMMPTAALAAPVNIVINGVDIGYTTGQYFSKNGKACTCHNQEKCVPETASCNCLHVAGTAQCYAFALYCEEKLYGYNDVTNPEKFETIGTSIAAGTLNAQNLKNLFSTAPIGAHIRTNGNEHSMILISKNETGFTVVQANGSNNNEYSGHSACRIGTATYTWESYVTGSYGSRGIKFVKACTLSPFLNMIVSGSLYDYDFEKVSSLDKTYVDYEQAGFLLFASCSYLDVSAYGMKFEYVNSRYSKRLPLSDAKWIYQNILNWSDETWDGLLAYAKSHGGYIGPNKYAIISNDGYLCSDEAAGPISGAGVKIIAQRPNEKKLEVVFDFISRDVNGNPSGSDTFYALVEQKTIGSQQHWTVYRTKKLQPGENPLYTQPAALSGAANPSNNSLSVNGQAASTAVYKIDGNNYFKLRDVAALLNGSGKQFNVG